MKLALEIRVPLVFALTLLLLIVIGGYSYRTMTKLRAGVEMQAHTYQVLTQTEDLLKTLVDAETGARGFVITGLDECWQLYRDAQRNFAGQFERLRALTRDNSEQHPRLDLLAQRSREKFEQLQTAIELRRTQGLNAVVESVPGSRGKALMDQLREIVKEIIDLLS